MDNEREFGRFEGMVLQKLEHLEQKLDAMQMSQDRFKQDAYARLNQNSQEIARWKGWLAGLGVTGGVLGSFIKSLIFGR